MLHRTAYHTLGAWPKCFHHRLQEHRQGSGTRSRGACRAEQEPGAEQPDLIERAVGALFGRRALQAAEPFGMKRMSDEAYAEQSVATLTELAAPVAGDSEDVRLFRPLLAKTRLEKAPLRWGPGQ